MLKNKRFLITGGNGGIGISIAEILLKNKASVVLTKNKSQHNIDNLLKKYPKFQDSVDVFKIDLTNSKKINSMMNKILKSYSIDGFIHSVTHPIEHKSFLELKWDDFQSYIDLQVKSFLEISKFLIPIMKERRQGKIVNILTEYTVGRPPLKLSNYILSKYALLGISKSLASELGQFRININCISPSMTNTPLISNLPRSFKEVTASKIPLKRLASPYDVASTALFLCSKNSDYITGENILVTGGNTMY